MDEAYFRESRSTEVIAVAWISTGLAIFTVLLKIITTTRITRSTGWDDFLIYASLILSILASCSVHYAAVLGLGRHTAAVLAEYGPERLALTAKMQILGYPAFSFPNIAIAILVNKLLNPNQCRKYSLLGMTALQVIFAAVMAVMAFVQCSPVEKLWDRTIADGTCWHPGVLNNYSYFVSAYTTLTDLVLAVVPISAFWSLQMSRSTKIGVSLLMSLTFLSAIVTLAKATKLHLFNDTVDPLYNVVTLVHWGLIEQNIVIFAACVPTLRPFFTRLLGRSRVKSGRSGPDDNNDNSNADKDHTLGLKSMTPSSKRRFSQQRLNGAGNKLAGRLTGDGCSHVKIPNAAAMLGSEDGSLSEAPLNQHHGAIESTGAADSHVNVAQGYRVQGKHRNSNSTDEDDEDDGMSLGSRRGIWKTVDVSMQWHHEEECISTDDRQGTAGGGGPWRKNKTRRDMIVPQSLSSQPDKQ